MRSSPMLQRLAKQLGLPERELLDKLSFLSPNRRPKDKAFQLLDRERLREYRVRCIGIGDITNKRGKFVQYAFELNDTWKHYSVLVKAPSFDERRLPVFTQHDYFLTRFDSHCETQMLFGDLTCDCMGQLEMAIDQIATRGEGAVIHVHEHEGRGKGIASKLDQLSICEGLGIDTVTASVLRAELVEGVEVDDYPVASIIDIRDFLGCVAILKYFSVPPKIKLMIQTNNPNKMKALTENGFQCDFFNVHTEPHELNRHHLEAKKERLKHRLKTD